MAPGYSVRRAEARDIPHIVRHRVGMFRDMGVLPPDFEAELAERTRSYLEEAIPCGEYLGWLAVTAGEPENVVAGAGVQIRRALPHPRSLHGGGAGIARGRHAIVLNVFTEAPCRRRGLARLLMEQVLDWARSDGVEVLVLHASGAGRHLYERLGFVPTNEMRFDGDLEAAGTRRRGSEAG
jgi:GNAT superfamily N-acetyltransferase